MNCAFLRATTACLPVACGNSPSWQINPFERAISERRELNDAPSFIDVVRSDGDTFSLAGYSLEQLLAGNGPPNSVIGGNSLLCRLFKSDQGTAFVRAVAVHLDQCATRLAVRNQHHEFLPTGCADDAFGVPHIFSTFQRRLQSMGKSKATSEQWLKTIDNFQKKGVRAEELDCSNLMSDLALQQDENEDEQFTAMELASLCYFKDLRISVMPVIEKRPATVELNIGTSSRTEARQEVTQSTSWPSS